MPSLSYPASFGLETKTIEISQVAGAGGVATWHVFIDRFFVASVSQLENDIRVHPGPGWKLGGDDIGALRDVIEELASM